MRHRCCQSDNAATSFVGVACHDAHVTLIVLVLVGVAVLIGVALVLSFKDDGLPDETIDHGDFGIPDRPLTPDDIPRLRFRIGWRGYRMEDVDAALDRVAESMRREAPPAE
jgi:DivIVA domain-containing protein